MPYSTFLAYLKCSDILRDEDNFQLLDVVTYPHAEKKGREKIWNKLIKFRRKVKTSSSGAAKYGDVLDKVRAAMNG